MIKRVILISALLIIAGGVKAGAAEDRSFERRLALIAEAGVPSALAAVPIKDERVMAGAAFAETRYYFIKGRGRKGGDWGRAGAAGVWLALLDDDYRENAALLYVKAGDAPGITQDGWITLKVFEREIMPAVATAGKSWLSDDEGRAKIESLAARATALHDISPAELLLVPGEEGKGWRPLNPRDAAWSDWVNLRAAYVKGDPRAMATAARDLAAKLREQPGTSPPWRIELEVALVRVKPLNIGFGFYVVASLLLFLWAALKRRWLADVAAAIAAGGLLLVTAGLIARALVAQHLPVTGMYEYLVLLGWAAVLFYLLFYARTRNGVVGVFALPAAFIAMVVASLFPSTIGGPLIPALQSWWLYIHVFLAVLGEGAFAVGAGLALVRIFRSDKEGGLLPPPARLEAWEYRAMAIGYPLFTLGALVAGAIWAQVAWSAWWSWDPKETAALAVFLIATAYLHVRRTRGWKGRRASVLALAVFAAAVFTLFANMVFGGLHSYGR